MAKPNIRMESGTRIAADVSTLYVYNAHTGRASGEPFKFAPLGGHTSTPRGLVSCGLGNCESYIK